MLKWTLSVMTGSAKAAAMDELEDCLLLEEGFGTAGTAALAVGGEPMAKAAAASNVGGAHKTVRRAINNPESFVWETDDGSFS